MKKFTREEVEKATQISKVFVEESRWNNHYKVVIEVDRKNWIGNVNYPKSEYYDCVNSYDELEFAPAVQHEKSILEWVEA